MNEETLKIRECGEKGRRKIGRDVDLLFRFRFTAPEIARLRIQPAHSANGVYV